MPKVTRPKTVDSISTELSIHIDAIKKILYEKWDAIKSSNEMIALKMELDEISKHYCKQIIYWCVWTTHQVKFIETMSIDTIYVFGCGAGEDMFHSIYMNVEKTSKLQQKKVELLKLNRIMFVKATAISHRIEEADALKIKATKQKEYYGFYFDTAIHNITNKLTPEVIWDTSEDIAVNLYDIPYLPIEVAKPKKIVFDEYYFKHLKSQYQFAQLIDKDNIYYNKEFTILYKPK